MIRKLRLALCGTYLLVTGCVSALRPVSEPAASHLGFTVHAPGVEGWRYQEKRTSNSWLLLYRWEDPEDEKHTLVAKLSSDRLEGQAEPGELKAFVEQLFHGRSSPSQRDERFTEREATLVRQDFRGTEAYRAHIVVEERDNPHLGGTPLLMETVIDTFMHPNDPSVLIQLGTSGRRPLTEERPSVAPLADSLLRSMEFERPGS